MKILVVYYSRTGITKKIAQSVADAFSADMEELIDTKQRQGTWGFAVAVKDAALKNLVPIEPPKVNPADYDLVIVGTPVWANSMCSAVRMFLHDFGKDITPIAAVFSTTHSSGVEEANGDMDAMIAAKTIARAGFREKDIKKDEHLDALNAFIEDIRQKTK